MKLAVFNGFVEDTLAANVQSITVRSRFGPTFTLDKPFEPGPPNPVLERMHPRVEIQLNGENPVVLQPYGDPGETLWPYVKWGAFGLGAALLLGYVRFGRRR